MKIKPGFILKEVAGQCVVLPGEGMTDLDMMITLNDTARFLWDKLTVGAEKTELVKALTAEYDVDEATATTAVDGFINKLKENDFLA